MRGRVSPAVTEAQQVMGAISAAITETSTPAERAKALGLGCQEQALHALGRLSAECPGMYAAWLIHLLGKGVPDDMLSYLDRAVQEVGCDHMAEPCAPPLTPAERRSATVLPFPGREPA